MPAGSGASSRSRLANVLPECEDTDSSVSRRPVRSRDSQAGVLESADVWLAEAGSCAETCHGARAHDISGVPKINRDSAAGAARKFFKFHKQLKLAFSGARPHVGNQKQNRKNRNQTK